MKRSIWKDTDGAVIPEFIIAVMPFLMLFFTTAQYSIIAYAQILTQHAAFMGARAAMVVCPDPKGEGSPEETIQKAVKLSYGPVGNAAKPQATVSGSCNTVDQGLVTVDVQSDFPCTVPLGGRLFCGGTKKTLRASASMPNQGSYVTEIYGGPSK
jgi:Flp pilus assembly protein TadG